VGRTAVSAGYDGRAFRSGEVTRLSKTVTLNWRVIVMSTSCCR
jgi:hypothetical protein